MKEREISVATVSKIECIEERKSKEFYKKFNKGDFVDMDFRFFPFPRIKKIIAEETLFADSWYGKFGIKKLYTKKELELNNNLKIVDDTVYIKPHIVISFNDGDKMTWYYDYNIDAWERYSELIDKLNLIRLKKNGWKN